ncbi:hypothetical protein FT663_02405 [Candidozyma haemuli var. vulneris]|nr:hypothetical protein FT662_05067 [[Candida] haemuloni var. vulneris]KAF3992215.1 hypothetical protein FT663_02405 [[Candida] haemuloni var. vulneris]
MMAPNTSQPTGQPLQDPSNQQQQQPLPPQAPSQQPAGHVQPMGDIKTQGSVSWNNHNPFDVNSYPITNPPIIDSTFFLPYTNEAGVQRRRRISISNGQIGQIINHEAFFADDDSYDEMNDVPFRYSHHNHHHHAPEPTHGNPNLGNPLFNDARLPYDQNPLQSQPDFVPRPPPSGPKMEDNDDVQPPPQPPGSAIPGPPSIPPSDPSSSFTSAQPPHPQGLRQEQSAPPEPPMPGEITPHSAIDDVAGVPPPNHQLIYNNEVIYSAEGGPIPGTAAWKKERLLERNRIAASKCRQRKKQAQQQLQNNISKYERESRDQKKKLQKYEKLFAIYDKTLSAYFNKKTTSIDNLRGFVGKPIEDLDL